MNKLKMFEAFSGIGTQSMALKKLGIDFDVVAISEIYEQAVKGYEAIHGKANNLGDISNININDIPNHDLFTYSFPCQDLTNDGKKEGLSGERSGLLYECEKIIQSKKPKYLLLENVKGLVNKNNKPNFEKWLEWLDKQGYDNYWQIVNAINYGIPQIRERVICVSVRKDIGKKFEFPKPIKLEKCLLDFLDDKVDKKYYLKDAKKQSLLYDSSIIIDNGNPKVKIVNGTIQGYLLAEHGDGVDFQRPESKNRRGRVQKQRIHTLSTQGTFGVILFDDSNDFVIRRLTPSEYWRLMGISEDDFRKVNTEDKHLYKMAGNAIVVDVLYYIFKELFKGDF